MTYESPLAPQGAPLDNGLSATGAEVRDHNTCQDRYRKVTRRSRGVLQAIRNREAPVSGSPGYRWSLHSSNAVPVAPTGRWWENETPVGGDGIDPNFWDQGAVAEAPTANEFGDPRRCDVRTEGGVRASCLAPRLAFGSALQRETQAPTALLNLSAFPMTETELKLMAAAASIGLRTSPNTG